MHERAIHFQSKCRSTLQLIEDISRSDTNAAYLACALYATLVAVAAKPDQIMKINITLQIYTTPTTLNALFLYTTHTSLNIHFLDQCNNSRTVLWILVKFRLYF